MIIILIVIIILFGIYFWKRYETYNNLNIYPTRLLGMRRYAKLNKNGRIISIDVDVIKPGIGESGCIEVLCPKYYSDTISCYYCK